MRRIGPELNRSHPPPGRAQRAGHAQRVVAQRSRSCPTVQQDRARRAEIGANSGEMRRDRPPALPRAAAHRLDDAPPSAGSSGSLPALSRKRSPRQRQVQSRAKAAPEPAGAPPLRRTAAPAAPAPARRRAVAAQHDPVRPDARSHDQRVARPQRHPPARPAADVPAPAGTPGTITAQPAGQRQPPQHPAMRPGAARQIAPRHGARAGSARSASRQPA